MIINLDVPQEWTRQAPKDSLERAALAALDQQRAPENAELNVVVGSSEWVQELNRQFRGIDSPTDVLSFEAGIVDPETGNYLLGDIAIAFPYAREQAEAAGHTVEAEMQLLVVHGVLHLLGLDHVEKEDTRAMWEAQYAIMDRLGVNIRSWPLISGAH